MKRFVTSFPKTICKPFRMTRAVSRVNANSTGATLPSRLRIESMTMQFPSSHRHWVLFASLVLIGSGIVPVPTSWLAAQEASADAPQEAPVSKPPRPEKTEELLGALRAGEIQKLRTELECLVRPVGEIADR